MSATALQVEYEPALVEAAVLAAVRERSEERSFLGERERAYEVADAEAREARFTDLHARWFGRLALDAPFGVALAERAEVGAGCGRAVVARAIAGGDESADLRVTPDARPTLLVLVRAETVSRPPRLLAFLRHELVHVADMLDAGFGYEPQALGDEGSARGRLARDRYRALWDAWVDGRLARLGRAPSGVRAERLRDFARAFPALGEGTEPAFERFFGAERLRHAELAAFATGAGSARPCPLCGLPAPRLQPAPERLPGGALAAIVRDFPVWAPGDGLCGRCAEIYVTRAGGGPRDEDAD